MIEDSTTRLPVGKGGGDGASTNPMNKFAGKRGRIGKKGRGGGGILPQREAGERKCQMKKQINENKVG